MIYEPQAARLFTGVPLLPPLATIRSASVTDAASIRKPSSSVPSVSASSTAVENVRFGIGSDTVTKTAAISGFLTA